jgi:hypothetical protein
MHTTDVPRFIDHGRAGWVQSMRRFFRRRGYSLSIHRYTPSLLSNSRKLYFVQGISPLDHKAHHMVLYRGNKLYYDPAGRAKRGLFGKPLYVYIPHKLPQ